MRGHTPIIAMRNRGKKPAFVYLDTTRTTAPMREWEDWPGVSPAIASVWIEPDDVPHRLDLRYVFGLSVVVTGIDADRVKALADAAYAAGALRVVASVTTGGPMPKTVSVTDTFGLLDNGTPEAARAAQLLTQHADIRRGLNHG